MQQVLRRRPLEHLVQRVAAVGLPAAATAIPGRGTRRHPRSAPRRRPRRQRGPPAELHLGVLRRDRRRLEVEEGLEAVELRLDRAEERHVAVAGKEFKLEGDVLMITSGNNT